MRLALSWWPRRRGFVQRHEPRGSGTATSRPATPDDAPGGCGWFDSSFELRVGLAVIEHREIPLDFAVQALLGLDAPAAPRAAPRQASRPVR